MKVLTLFLGIPIIYIVVPYLVNIVTQYPGQVIHQNSVVLVTGASSGIGLSAAIALKKKGYFVIGGIRKEKDAVRLQKTYDLQTVILDVTKEVDIERSKQGEFNRFVKKGLCPSLGWLITLACPEIFQLSFNLGKPSALCTVSTPLVSWI